MLCHNLVVLCSFQKTILCGYFVLQSFYSYALEFTNLFFPDIYFAIPPIQWIFHLTHHSFLVLELNVSLKKKKTLCLY